jgi:DNA repair exonuclease SbcCD ATPase subunit
MQTLAALFVAAYVFIPHGTNMMSSNVNLNRALEIRHRFGSHFLWVCEKGVEYVIRDETTLDRIEHLFDSAHAFSPEVERLHERMRPIEKREEQLDREIDAISDDEDRSPRDEERRRDLERRLRDVESQLRDFERQEEALDAKQDRLEDEAERRMVPIIDEAIRSGAAKRYPAVD